MPQFPFSNSVINQSANLNTLIKRAILYSDTGSLFTINKYGQVRGANVGGAKDLWRAGDRIVYPSAEEALSIVSDSALDDVNNIGGKKVYLTGLDENYHMVSEVIELKGLTPVLTSNNYLRLNEAYVTEVGSNQGAIGTITIKQSLSDLVLGSIQPNAGGTQNSHYTVPKGYTAFLIDEEVCLKGSVAEVVPLISKPNYNGYTPHRVIIGNERSSRSFKVPTRITETHDFAYFVIPSSNNTVAIVNYTLLLIPNTSINEDVGRI